MKKDKKAEFVKWMGPILNALRILGGSGSPKEVSSKIAELEKLSDEYVEEKIKSGVSRFHNQVCWARQYLVWEGYLDSTKRGTWTLSKKGEKTHLNFKESHEIFLKWVDIFSERRNNLEIEVSPQDKVEELEEFIDNEQNTTSSHREILLSLLRKMSWKNFEKFSLLLLRENGFEDLKLTGEGKDEGIDGIGVLKINPFVTFKILFQCKRFAENNSVGRQKIADFRNSMLGRADKGIFITTSYFTADAIREATRDGAQQIELVDADKLVSLLEEKEFGLQQKITYTVDYDFFKQFE